MTWHHLCTLSPNRSSALLSNLPNSLMSFGGFGMSGQSREASSSRDEQNITAVRLNLSLYVYPRRLFPVRERTNTVVTSKFSTAHLLSSLMKPQFCVNFTCFELPLVLSYSVPRSCHDCFLPAAEGATSSQVSALIVRLWSSSLVAIIGSCLSFRCSFS